MAADRKESFVAVPTLFVCFACCDPVLSTLFPLYLFLFTPALSDARAFPRSRPKWTQFPLSF